MRESKNGFGLPEISHFSFLAPPLKFSPQFFCIWIVNTTDTTLRYCLFRTSVKVYYFGPKGFG